MATRAALIEPKQETAKTATPAVRRTNGIRHWLDDRIEKGKNKVFAERITVTPELAYILLEHNKDNRKLRPAKLAQLKNDMNENRFKMNGESIIVAKSGELNDGQHRLQAIVETNKPQDMLITFGVERESRFTVDTGAARSAGDHLSLSGWPYGPTIAAVARMVIGFERQKNAALGQASDLSSSQVMARAENDKLLQECASYIASQTGKFKLIGKQSLAGFCFYEIASRRPLEAKTFMDKLRTGTDLTENNPIRVLREYLIARPKLSTTQAAEVFFRAWNYWITDKEISQIKVFGKFPPIEG